MKTLKGVYFQSSLGSLSQACHTGEASLKNLQVTKTFVKHIYDEFLLIHITEEPTQDVYVVHICFQSSGMKDRVILNRAG